jgi:hypothetical protein
MGVEWVVVLVGVGASTEWDSQSLSVGVLIIDCFTGERKNKGLVDWLYAIYHTWVQDI